MAEYGEFRNLPNHEDDDNTHYAIQQLQQRGLKAFYQRNVWWFALGFIVLILLLIFLFVHYAGPLGDKDDDNNNNNNPSLTPAQQLQQVTILQMFGALNLTADPCQDFYEFSCGGWIASTPLPADSSLIYLVINAIADNNEKEL